jgi:sarcosine/dimethylglycine N-methyltransferase
MYVQLQSRLAGMLNSTQAVADHYKRRASSDIILAALKAAGKDIEHLTPDDLAPVDEFHTGQRNATVRLAQLAGVSGCEKVLDVGCGIGGPSRYLASAFGCEVTGLDLTTEFIELAQMLAGRTGLSRKVTYRQGNALDLPFADASFDLVWSQNAAMNIAYRDRLYSEMRRVLKLSGRLAIQDVAAGSGGEPFYPAPWAQDKSISFLLTPQLTRETMERAGSAGASHRACQSDREQIVAAARPSHPDWPGFSDRVEEHAKKSAGRPDQAPQRGARAGVGDKRAFRAIWQDAAEVNTGRHYS